MKSFLCWDPLDQEWSQCSVALKHVYIFSPFWTIISWKAYLFWQIDTWSLQWLWFPVASHWRQKSSSGSSDAKPPTNPHTSWGKVRSFSSELSFVAWNPKFFPNKSLKWSVYCICEQEGLGSAQHSLMKRYLPSNIFNKKLEKQHGIFLILC